MRGSWQSSRPLGGKKPRMLWRAVFPQPEDFPSGNIYAYMSFRDSSCSTGPGGQDSSVQLRGSSAISADFGRPFRRRSWLCLLLICKVQL